MKMNFGKACVAAIGMMVALPAAAQQQGGPLLAGETALAYAQRTDVCAGAGIVGAQFAQGQQLVQVQCAGAGLGMGSPGAAAAAAGGAILVIAVLASDSSSTTTSN